MFGEEKNLKDQVASLGIAIKDNSELPISYGKTDKLITALYMVTDILDKDEPIRNKLRTLGTGIISDIHLMSEGQAGRIASLMLANISQIFSFLDIASAVNLISEMNCNILRKEFSELNESIRESIDIQENTDRKIDLAEFFQNSSSPFQGRTEERLFNLPHLSPLRSSERGKLNPQRHHPTSLGVQKGSTLLKALSNRNINGIISDNFDALKKQRRESIIDILKLLGGSGTIKDIKDKIKNIGEKTLQRELGSMVKDRVLDKTGEKRWSRYFIR